MMTEDPLRYSDSGVNYDLMDPFKIACQKAALTTGKNVERFDRYGLGVEEIWWSRGESAYKVRVRATRPITFDIAHVEEGLGTKNIIAQQMRELQAKIKLAEEASRTFGRTFYRGIAIDNAAMILNDLATAGASPVSFMLHVAAFPSDWFTDEARNADLIAGTVDACNQARCAWGGGESPALRDIINPGHALLSGSAIGFEFPGWTEGGFSEDKISIGDKIILFKSSGLHANGITLLRTRLLDRLPQGYETFLPDGQNYGEAILAPTIIYCRLVDELLERHGRKIHYALHISGHGWRKLMRAQREFSYVVDKVPEPQPIFNLIQEVSGMTDEQIYGDYNMGTGFALLVDPTVTSRVVNQAEELGYEAIDAGYVEKGPRRVVIEPLGIEFKGESLQIR